MNDSEQDKRLNTFPIHPQFDLFIPRLKQKLPKGWRFGDSPEGITITDDPNQQAIIFGPDLDNLSITPLYCGRVVQVDYVNHDDEEYTTKFLYKGKSMDPKQFDEQKVRLANQALVEEIHRFLEEHKLIMFVDPREHNIGGVMRDTFGISFYDADTYSNEGISKPLYDTDFAQIRVLDFSFDYPIWDGNGKVNGNADLRLRINDSVLGERLISIRESVLREKPYSALDMRESFDRGERLNHTRSINSSDYNLPSQAHTIMSFHEYSNLTSVMPDQKGNIRIN